VENIYFMICIINYEIYKIEFINNHTYL